MKCRLTSFEIISLSRRFPSWLWENAITSFSFYSVVPRREAALRVRHLKMQFKINIKIHRWLNIKFKSHTPNIKNISSSIGKGDKTRKKVK